MRRLLFCFVIGFAFASAGCGDEPPAVAAPTQPSTPALAKAHSFDPASCGTITGFVTWTKPIPNVPDVPQLFPSSDGKLDLKQVPLANAPHIDRNTYKLEGVVVYLREVNTATAKPWDLPPVVVEFRDSQLVVTQGDHAGRSGFVRRGTSVEMRSAESRHNILRGRGADFFSLAFPEPEQSLSRQFDNCGRIELTNPAGAYWQSANLFVCDHPYYAVSGKDGRFTFTNVPEGQYDLVAWHPNWNVIRTERNPETGLPSRLIFDAPMEPSRPVVVNRGRPTVANLTLPQ